jgi:hypothetical protein
VGLSNPLPGTGDDDELWTRFSEHEDETDQGISSLKQANSNTIAREILKYLTGRNFVAVIDPRSPPATTTMIQ